VWLIYEVYIEGHSRLLMLIATSGITSVLGTWAGARKFDFPHPRPETRHVCLNATMQFSVEYSTMVVVNSQPCNAMIVQKVYSDSR